MEDKHFDYHCDLQLCYPSDIARPDIEKAESKEGQIFSSMTHYTND